MTRGAQVAVALVVLAGAAPASAAARFALTIGNNFGAPGEAPLRWAEADARRVRDVFVALGQVEDDRAIVLEGRDADAVRNALARLRGRIEETNRAGYRTELFVFYSGHGDVGELHLGRSRLSVTELRALVRGVPAASTITVIDACRSDISPRARRKGASHAAPFDVNLVRETGPSGHVLITSAGPNEVAQESDDLSASFFTHYFVSGMRGAADSDADGRVTLTELYAYTYNQTLAASHGETAAVQHAEISMDLEGEGQLVLSQLDRATSSLNMEADLAGEVLIVDDRSGRVIAEMHKARGAPATLALPPGRFRVQLRSQGRIYAGEIALEWGGQTTLTPDALSEQDLVAALEKGSSLDPSPWLVSLGAMASTPVLLSSDVAVGVTIGVEYLVSDFPIYLGGLANLTYASANVTSCAQCTTVDIDLRVGGTLGSFLWLGPVRTSIEITFGPLFVIDNGDLLHGIFIGPELAARLPIGWGFGIGAEFGVHSAWWFEGNRQLNNRVLTGGLTVDWWP